MSLVARLAELAVVLGAGVQPGQVVHVDAEVAHGELVRAITEAAYRHGARYVDVVGGRLVRDVTLAFRGGRVVSVTDLSPGSDEVEVLGVDASGRERPLLGGGDWQIRPGATP